MKTLYKLIVVLLTLFLEIAIFQFGPEFFWGRSHGMMADAQYRRSERLAAYREYHQHPSPETKDAFNEEMRLMHKHEDWKWESALGLFVVFNGVGIYYYLRHEHRAETASHVRV